MPAKPKINYVICSIQRTGSTFLSDSLIKTGLAGYPYEIFSHNIFKQNQKQWQTANLDAYIKKAIKVFTTPNGVFGFKIHYLDYLRHHKLPMEAIFPNLKYLYITRKDHVRQAISFSKALQTGKFLWQENEAKKPEFKLKEINTLIKEIEGMESDWENYFIQKQIKPYRLVYEDFVDSHQKTIRNILDFLGITYPEDLKIALPDTKKQTNNLNEEWLLLYETFTEPEKIYEKAAAYFENKKYERAQPLFEALTYYDNQNSEYLYKLGVSLFQQENYQKALLIFSNYLKMEKLTPEVRNYISLCLAKTGNQDLSKKFRS